MDRIAFLDRLTNSFSEGEIRNICVDLQIDYESLPDIGKSNKSRELFLYLERRNRLEELYEICDKLRPDIDWDCSESRDTQDRGNEKVKILFLAANPKDTSRLDLSSEVREIDESLRLSKFGNQFILEQSWAVRVKDLQDCLLRYQPTIVHFSGHGSSKGEIILQDNFDQYFPISSTSLSRLFSVLRDNIKCVVLNACYSEIQANAIAEHIECVVGMSKSIGDQAAISFAAAFYRALAYGRDPGGATKKSKT